MVTDGNEEFGLDRWPVKRGYINENDDFVLPREVIHDQTDDRARTHH